jgi:acyl-CoA thioesterase-1
MITGNAEPRLPGRRRPERRARRGRPAAVVVAFAVVALVGCGSSGSSTTPTTPRDFGQNNSSVYLAFGDSITRGLGVPAESAYPARLEALLKRVDSRAIVVNRGVGGETTAEGLARFASVLAAERPGFVLIMEGTNSPEASDNVNNLREMVRRAKANKTVPLVGAVPPQFGELEFKNRLIAALNGRIAGMAAGEDVTFVDTFTPLNRSDLFRADGLHPNADGHSILAEVWFGAILGVR